MVTRSTDPVCRTEPQKLASTFAVSGFYQILLQRHKLMPFLDKEAPSNQ